MLALRPSLVSSNTALSGTITAAHAISPLFDGRNSQGDGPKTDPSTRVSAITGVSVITLVAKANKRRNACGVKRLGHVRRIFFLNKEIPSFVCGKIGEE
jgi:hypothetical protein